MNVSEIRWMAKIKIACAPESLKSIIICIVVFPSFPKEIALDMTFLSSVLIFVEKKPLADNWYHGNLLSN